jgi:hypothetical protein
MKFYEMAARTRSALRTLRAYWSPPQPLIFSFLLPHRGPAEACQPTVASAYLPRSLGCLVISPLLDKRVVINGLLCLSVLFKIELSGRLPLLHIHSSK